MKIMLYKFRVVVTGVIGLLCSLAFVWAGSFVLSQRLGEKGIQFDAKSFDWVGVPVRDSPICVLTKASGINSIQDWFAAKRQIKLGGLGPGSTPSVPARVLKAALGLPIQLIDGYISLFQKDLL
jgi:hypothetical protein